MINTTLCYIRQGGQCLMLHRVKKENDLNQGKWIGIGGKFEDGESPEDCMFREVNEETGLTQRNTAIGGWSLLSPTAGPRSTCICSPSTALPEP